MTQLEWYAQPGGPCRAQPAFVKPTPLSLFDRYCPMIRQTVRISIAMTTYNSDKFVAEQLESFVRQERPPDELVVSDDASTDRTIKIVRDFAAQAPFPVRLLVNPQNLGVTKNFERAISGTTGEIIFLSDSDDYWYPRKILLMAKALEDIPQAGLAVCNADIANELLETADRTLWAHVGFSPGPKPQNAPLGVQDRACWLPAGGCCLAMRAALKPLVLPLPTGQEFKKGGHDIFIFRTILCSGAATVALVPTPLLAYRRHPGQATHSPTAGFLGRLSSRLASCRERPYLLEPLIERVGSNLAARYSLWPAVRASALLHWRARKSLPTSLTRRLPVVARELLTLRYHRFSRGLPTAAKDLLLLSPPPSATQGQTART